jgi:hypothetical protein
LKPFNGRVSSAEGRDGDRADHGALLAHRFHPSLRPAAARVPPPPRIGARLPGADEEGRAPGYTGTLTFIEPGPGGGKRVTHLRRGVHGPEDGIRPSELDATGLNSCMARTRPRSWTRHGTASDANGPGRPARSVTPLRGTRAEAGRVPRDSLQRLPPSTGGWPPTSSSTRSGPQWIRSRACRSIRRSPPLRATQLPSM